MIIHGVGHAHAGGARVHGADTSISGSEVVFTDDLTDGAGTPVAITTSILANQAWQRGRANITLAGTYSTNGGDPSSMAWRVGSGDWVALTAETIGSGNWSGTLSIPSDYLAQGTFEIKPINGLNVTPATLAGITVTDVFGILGDSMAADGADNSDPYSGTFTWREYNGTAWASVTGQTSIWPELANRLDAAGIPPAIARYAVPGTAFRPYLGGSAGGCWRPNPDNGDSSFYYDNGETRLSNAKTGGFALLLWEHGPNDVIDGNTFYDTDVSDLLDELALDVPDWGNTKLMLSLMGEVDPNETGLVSADQNTAVRQLQNAAATNDADILRGPSWIDLDMGDGVHIGRSPAGVEQQKIAGERWWRSIEAYLYSGAAPQTGPSISSAAVTGARTIAVTFDRAMANHTDITGWSVSDNSGAVAVASAAQGASTSQIVLTMGADLRTNTGEVTAVTLSFGEANDGVGSTLRDTETIYFPAEFVVDFDGGEALPFNTAVPTVDVSPAIGVASTATNGTWQSTSALSYTYRWLEEVGGAAISGETGASFTGQSPRDDGYISTVVCEVTATNTLGSSTAETSATFTPSDSFAGGIGGGWWQVEDETTMWQNTAASTAVTTDADPVARIDDSSPNSNHLLNATALETLTFDTDDTYQNVFGDGVMRNLITAPFAADGDILMICAADFTAATGTILSIGNNDALSQYIYIEHDRVRHVSNDFGSNSSVSIAPTGRAVVTVVATEGDMSFRVYVDGTLAGTGTKTGTGWFDTTSTDKIVALARRTAPSFQDYNPGAIYGATVLVGANVAAQRADLETYYGNLIGLSL